MHKNVSLLESLIVYASMMTCTVAEVGLMKNYQVSEDDAVVEICAFVNSPSIECPVEYHFNVHLSTTDETAGNLAVL